MGAPWMVNVDGVTTRTTLSAACSSLYLGGIQEFNVVTDRYTAESVARGHDYQRGHEIGYQHLHGTGFGLFIVPKFNTKDFFTGEKGNPQKRFHLAARSADP